MWGLNAPGSKCSWGPSAPGSKCLWGLNVWEPPAPSLQMSKLIKIFRLQKATRRYVLFLSRSSATLFCSTLHHNVLYTFPILHEKDISEVIYFAEMIFAKDGFSSHQLTSNSDLAFWAELADFDSWWLKRPS